MIGISEVCLKISSLKYVHKNMVMTREWEEFKLAHKGLFNL